MKIVCLMYKIYFVHFFITVVALNKAGCNILDTKHASQSKLNFSLSPLYFASLAAKESQIYQLLKSYNATSTKVQQRLVTPYLVDYEETLEVGTFSWEVTNNPLLIFRMVWRVVFQISQLIEQFSRSKVKKDIELGRRLNATLGPISGDEMITKTTVALLNIHHIFDFPAAETALGIFDTIQTGVRLTPFQMMEIAYIGIGWEYYTLAKYWLDSVEAMALESKDEVNLEELKLMQKDLAERHDRVFSNKSQGGNLHIFSQPLSSGYSDRIKTPELRDWLDYSDGSGLQREKMIKVFGLCSNSSLFKSSTGRRVRSQRGLECWNDFKRRPYFRISPLKTELLSLSPKIYMFHDILRENGVKTLESLSLPGLLEDAAKPETDLKGKPRSRAFLEKKSLPPQLNLVSKLEQVTGLRVAGNASENIIFSLTNLGDDGRGFLSHDAYIASRQNETELFADRVSTIQIFLSDVVLGGEIVFPDLDLVIKPVHGALLYWENYHKDGKVDWRSYHGSCPTVLGHKLIATTFIRAVHNMLSRPCGLRPSQDFHWA